MPFSRFGQPAGLTLLIGRLPPTGECWVFDDFWNVWGAGAEGDLLRAYRRAGGPIASGGPVASGIQAFSCASFP